MKKIIIFGIIVIILSSIVMSIINIQGTPSIEKEMPKEWKQIVPDIDSRITESCITSYYDETKYTQVNCTNITYQTNCTNNKSIDCKPIEYTQEECDTLKTIIEQSKTNCKDTSLEIDNINKEYDIQFKEFGHCTHEKDKKDNSKIKITCDSYYDSNRDGICQSGESCCIYTCNKDECDFDEKNCDLNPYIKRIQEKQGLNKISITDTKAVIK